MISVIIPIYNLERYLSPCIDSVLASTYQDFELILVNDGSTDASLRICEDYAARDSRIRLLNQDNRGVSAARNRGMEICRGEWIVFVDGDDMISEDFLALIAQESSQGPDLMLFDFAPQGSVPSFGNKGEIIHYGKEDTHNLLRCTLLLQQLRKRGNVNFLSACARAIKKSFIDQYGIHFSESLFGGEDTLFNIEYQFWVQSCIYIPHAVYFYRIYRDSSSHRFNPRLPDNNELLVKLVKQTLEEHGAFSSLEREYNSFALNLLTSLLFRSIFSPSNPKTFREKRVMCQRFQENEIFREAMTCNSRSGTLQRRVFLFIFQLRWYRTLNLLCRILHIIWRKKGIC